MLNTLRTPKHFHRPMKIQSSPFARCVGMACNNEAHGGVTQLQECTCGMSRRVNVNEESKEFGSWTFIGEVNA